MDFDDKRTQMLSSLVEGQYNLTKQHIYQITIKTLTKLFDNEIPMDERLEELNKLGGPLGVLQATGSNPSTGIMGDDRDIKRRQSFFGPNKKPIPQLPPFWDSFKDAIDDRILLTVAVFGILTMITGLIYDPSAAIDGIAILVSILLLVLITSINDWRKDTKFVELQQLGASESLTTVRGKSGNTETTSVWKLVTGDVIYLNTGDNIPADCILISSNNLECDETYHENHGENVPKDVNTDPFLFAEANITKGTCKAFVCAVGDASSRGPLAQKFKTSGDTPLETKLQGLATTFTYIGILSSLVILITAITILIIKASASEDLGGAQFTKELVDCFTLALILIMVAIPEGLPMTVGVSLAYSVMKMFYKDKILVQDLEKPEVLGQISEIITGKTGTMTSEDMKVERFYAQSTMIENSRLNTLVHCTQVSDDVKLRLKENITFNTGATIEMSENAEYVAVGQGTDVSLLRFLQDAEFPVHYNVRSRPDYMVYEIPFASDYKRQLTVIKHPEIDDTYRIYVKGAPEQIVHNCTSYFMEDGSKVPMDQNHGNYILNDVFYPQIAQVGLRGIAFAFKDIHTDEFEAIKQQINPTDELANLALFENELTFSAIVGLRDPLRNRVQKVVQYCAKGSLVIRVVSGDNVETVKRTAIEAGIISEEEANMDHTCMDAADFQARFGPKQVSGQDNYELRNQGAFDDFMAAHPNALKVLGRASADDKLLLVTAIKGQDKKIGVIGDNLNDIPTFKYADVSFSMGSGVALAREMSSLVLVTDEFESAIRGVMWGRNIYNNIRRFLQFQVTINFSVLTITLIGIIALTEAPFNPTMLLYINLIMDVMGALALTTQPPSASIIRQAPVSGDQQIMQKVIWRQIYSLALWNIIVLCIIIFFGRAMFNLNYEASTSTANNNDSYTAPCGLQVRTVEGLMANEKLQHLTIIFNTFVFLCFFNLINCRTVGVKDFNVFTSFFNNPMFLFILALIFGLQVVWCNYVTFIFGTAQIDAKNFWTCVVWGSTSLAVSAIVKATPADWVEKIPVKIDEDKPMGEDSSLMKMYNDTAKGKVSTAASGNKQAQINEDDDDYQNEDSYENQTSQ